MVRVTRFESRFWRMKKIRRYKPFQIRWGERLGMLKCPYLTRWCLITPLGSIRLHKWMGPDDDRHLHNHPWNFVTFVLKGGYKDIHREGEDVLMAPSVKYRPANHFHTVRPLVTPTWTLIITGPKIQRWGFDVDGVLWEIRKYFKKKKHHPCED